MRKLVNQLLEDSHSGLKRDASGRQYFKQRKVRFRTVYFHPDELLEGGWLEFQQDIQSPFSHQADPSPAQLKEFAASSSERFLHFYYRVFDVAIARALATLDTNLFRLPFIQPSVYLDLGIPEDSAVGSVPPALSSVILKQYYASKHYLTASKTNSSEGASHSAKDESSTESDRHASQKQNSLTREYSGTRISYLSSYLDGLTDDAIFLLAPYRELWDLEDRLREIQNRSRRMRQEFESLFLGQNGSEVYHKLTSHFQQAFQKHGMRNVLQSISSAELRANVRTFLEQNDSNALPYIIRHSQEIRTFLDESTLALVGLYLLPERLEFRIRSALLQESRLHARIMRYNFLRYRSVPMGTNTDLKLLHDQRNRSRKEANQILESAIKLNSDIQIWKDLLQEHADVRARIRRIYEDYLQHPAQIHRDRSATEASSLEDSRDDLPIARKQLDDSQISAKLKYGKTISWPDHIDYGNPFARREVLQSIKEQLLERLRPVRSTTTGYSLIPGSRHGILPLNPVMKLWKEKPGFEKDLPEIASLEINTPATVDCLLSLAQLVDNNLFQRELRLGRILKEKLGSQNLASMKILLMPGSCGAAREIERPDFPEFRNLVIGESRKPQELGVAGEASILTGAWYKKRNHALYYPIGGDNGQLIRSIFLALRLPGPAAFFFALGQFVHDCLPDNLVYYAGSEIPFRQITEDYYRQEDRVRKHRGEKTGRRRIDNSRPAVRFMFSVAYSRALMEALTGSSQSHFRHPPTEQWMSRYLEIPVLAITDRNRFRKLRSQARNLIQSFSVQKI